MKPSFTTITALGLAVALFCFSSAALSDAPDRKKRGDAPECQDLCLKDHSERMARLEKDLSGTGRKLVYEERVEQEESRYARCLSSCRMVLPVK